MTDAFTQHPDDESLQRFADGEVDADSDVALVAHIADCATCQAAVERIRRVTAALALASRPSPRLDALVQQERRPRWHRAIFPLVALAAAALAWFALNRREISAGRERQPGVPQGPVAHGDTALRDSAGRPRQVPAPVPNVDVGFNESGGRVLLDRTLRVWSAGVADSVRSALTRDRSAVVTISADTLEAGARTLADSLVAYLHGSGIADSRIQRTLAGGTLARGVRITVRLPAR